MSSWFNESLTAFLKQYDIHDVDMAPDIVESCDASDVYDLMIKLDPELVKHCFIQEIAYPDAFWLFFMKHKEFRGGFVSDAIEYIKSEWDQ